MDKVISISTQDVNYDEKGPIVHTVQKIYLLDTSSIHKTIGIRLERILSNCLYHILSRAMGSFNSFFKYISEISKYRLILTKTRAKHRAHSSHNLTLFFVMHFCVAYLEFA